MQNYEINRRGPEMFDNETPDQVQLTISTDLGYTADFLRQLANAIEANKNEFTDYETYRGAATIVWPE